MSRCPGCPYPASSLVPGEGLDRPRLVVGMAPGYEEALYGQPFHPRGASGEMIRGLVGDRPDVGWTNAVQCYPGKVESDGEKKRFATARSACRSRLLSEVSGKEILGLGNDALHSLLGRAVKITGFRGSTFSVDGNGTSGLASFHPAYAIRSGGLASNAGQLLRRDVETWLGAPKAPEPRIEIDPVAGAKPGELWSKRGPGLIDGFRLPPPGTPIVVDIETTGLDPKTPGARIRCYGFAWLCDKTPYSVVFSKPNRFVKRLLSGAWPLIAQNYVFEVKWLSRHGPVGLDVDGWMAGKYQEPCWHDTMLMAHCAHEDRGPGKYNLDSLAADYLPPFPTKAALLGEYDVLSAPLEVLMPYCAWDCVKELLLFHRFKEEVYGLPAKPNREARRATAPAQRNRRVPANLVQVSPSGGTRLERVALPAALFLDRVRDRGLRVDRTAVDRELKRIDEEVAALDVALQAVKPINWNSDAQVRIALHDLGLKPSGIKTKTGAHSLGRLSRCGIIARATSTEAAWAVALFGKRKFLVHEHGNFLGPKGLVAGISPDGRTHPRFNQTGTRTFRLSAPASEDGEEQTAATIQTLEASRRRCIVPEKGCVLLEVDYDQAEPCWSAFLSQDPWLLDAVTSGKDLHQVTADALGIERKPAKAIRLALNYGGGIPAVKKKLDEQEWGRWSESQIATYIQQVKALTPGYEAWAHERWLEARETGGVLSPFGAFMRIPGATGTREVLAEAKRQAANSPIQESASTATTVRAMELSDLDVWTLTHDSILFNVKRRELKRTVKRVKAVMESPQFYWGEMPFLRVSFKAGASWGEMEKL